MGERRRFVHLPAGATPAEAVEVVREAHAQSSEDDAPARIVYLTTPDASGDGVEAFHAALTEEARRQREGDR